MILVFTSYLICIFTKNRTTYNKYKTTNRKTKLNKRFI